ncbi:MAG: hypothetical protein QNJ54_11385 [Prochloraceae cyanobacterium]|nr:hypothetical protein [Prochloraceae cyanobacterium]
MSILSQVVGALLIELSAAQNAANKYSSEISLEYQEDTREEEPSPLANYPVPNGLLKEIELNLKFSINNVKERREETGNLVNIRNIFQRESKKLVQKAIQPIVKYIDENKATAEEKIRKRWEALATNIQKTEFINLLSNILTKTLFKQRKSLIGEEGVVREEAIRNLINEILDESFQGNEDLNSILDKNTERGRQIRQGYEEGIGTFIESLKEKKEELSKFSFNQMDVIVNCSELKDLPSEVISSIKIKAELVNYKWLVTDQGAKLERT